MLHLPRQEWLQRIKLSFLRFFVGLIVDNYWKILWDIQAERLKWYWCLFKFSSNFYSRKSLDQRKQLWPNICQRTLSQNARHCNVYPADRMASLHPRRVYSNLWWTGVLIVHGSRWWCNFTNLLGLYLFTLRANMCSSTAQQVWSNLVQFIATSAQTSSTRVKMGT